MEWYEIAVSILSGLAVTIPLVVKLAEYIKLAISERNWTQLIELVTNLMKEAEQKFESGAEKKEWVLMAIKASADTIDYKIDLEYVSQLIDSLCAMSKIVNAPEEKVEIKD